MAHLNFSPSALAAAGVSAQETSALVANARQYMTDNPGELASATDSLQAAQSDADRLSRLVQSGQATQEDRAALETALSSLNTAMAARSSAAASLRTAAEASLSQAKQDALSTMRSNLGRKLPLKYLVVNRSDADWVALREAIANDQQASAASVDPDPACHQRLLDANGIAATSTASQNLVTLLGDVTTAFHTAVTGG
jgi:hypothetical protein